MRILFVSSANVCRSPVAERLTTAWAEQGLGPLAALVRVRSRGIDAPEGQEMDPRSAQALRALGGDAKACYARQLIADEPVNADLVLTMTRRHRHVLLKSAPRAMRRTFTLAETAALVPLADVRGIDALPLGERAGELALRLNAARTRRPASAADDIADPLGEKTSVHEAAARQIAAGLEPIMSLLLVPAGAGTLSHV